MKKSLDILCRAVYRVTGSQWGRFFNAPEKGCRGGSCCYDAVLLDVDLLIPVTVLAVGLLCRLRPPRRINMFCGYRTRRSMASQMAWDEAHRLYGRILLRVGPPLIVFTVLIKLLVPLPSEILTLALLPFSLAVLIAPIPVVEKRLKAMGRGRGN